MSYTRLPIGEVAQRFDVRASTLRYYEEIKLLKPSTRRSGRRYYGSQELKRLALIQLLQSIGRLTLDEIAAILASRNSGRSSRRILKDRVAILSDQIRSAEAAKSYLEYRLSCPRENPFDGCTVLADEVNRRIKRAGLCVHSIGADGQEIAKVHCHAIAD